MIVNILTHAYSTASHQVSKVVASQNYLHGSLRLLNVRITCPQTHKYICVNEKWFNYKESSDSSGDKDVANKASIKARKTYVMHNITIENNDADSSASDMQSKGIDSFAPSAHRTQLTAEKVYKNIQSKFINKHKQTSTPSDSNNSQGKEWIIKNKQHSYNLDLMYKSVENRRNKKLFESIKSVYLKRVEELESFLNKSRPESNISQKTCAHSSFRTLKSRRSNNAYFHTSSRAWEKKEETDKKSVNAIEVVQEVSTAGQETLNIDKSSAQRTEAEIKTLKKESAQPLAEHCQHRVVHTIHHEDESSKEKSVLKRTEEMFDLEKAEKGKPFHIKSVTYPLESKDLHDDSSNLAAQTTEKQHPTLGEKIEHKTFTRLGKLHPGSLEYMWVEILVPKILNHIKYLNECNLRGDNAELIYKTLRVNSLDFIKKDPRTKFSGFPPHSERARVDDEAIAPSQDTTNE